MGVTGAPSALSVHRSVLLPFSFSLKCRVSVRPRCRRNFRTLLLVLVVLVLVLLLGPGAWPWLHGPGSWFNESWAMAWVMRPGFLVQWALGFGLGYTARILGSMGPGL